MTTEMERNSSGTRPRLISPASGLVLIAALLAFAGICVLQVARNPLRMDEVDYFQSMTNLVKLGLPIYYAGEVEPDPSRLLHLSTRQLNGQAFEFYRFKPETGIRRVVFFALTDGRSQYTYWMFHPPLYVYLGALFLRVFPLSADNSSQLRCFNLIFILAVFAGMAVLGRELYPGYRPWVFVIALLFWISNRIATAGSLLIDYNAALAPSVAIWYAVAYLRSQRRRVIHCGLMAATALALLTSLGLGLSLAAGTLIHITITRRHARPWHSLVSVLAGAIAFVLLFWLLCHLLQLPFSQPFLYNWQRWGVSPDPRWFLGALKDALAYAVMYSRDVGHLAGLLGLALFIKILATREAFQQPARAFLPTMVLVGALLQGSLRAEAYGFPKYILFLLPLLFLFISGEALALLHSSKERAYLRKAAVITPLAAALLVQSVTLAGDLRQPGGTLYLRGERGITEIAQQVKALSDPDDVILSPKDIAFFAGRRFVEWHGPIKTQTEILRRRLAQDNIRLFVSNAAGLSTASGQVVAYLDTQFATEAALGDFMLFRAREQ